MSERPTLLSRGGGAPTIQPTQSGVVQGAFGDYRGVIAAGQGLSNVGDAAASYSMRLKAELESRKINDYKLEASNAIAVAVTGVNKEYSDRREADELGDDPSSEYEGKLAKAFGNVRQELAGISSDPVFKKHIGDAEIQAMWNAKTESLRVQAAGDTGAAREKRRIVSLNTLASTMFAGVPAGDFGALHAEMADKMATVEASKVGDDVKLNITAKIRAAGYEQAARAPVMGIPIPKEVIESKAFGFDPGQKRMLEHMNAELMKPGPGPSQGQLEKDLDQVLDEQSRMTYDEYLRPINAARREQAAVRLMQAEKTEPGRVAVQAKVSLNQALVAFKNNGWSKLGEVGGEKLFKGLKKFESTINDAAAMSKWYDSLNIPGASPEVRDKFISTVSAGVLKDIHLYETGRGSEVIDAMSDVAPVADALFRKFSASPALVKKEEATAYMALVKKKQEDIGLPQHLQSLIPRAISDTLLDRVHNNDSTNATLMTLSIANTFGGKAVRDLANYLLAPARSRGRQEGVDPSADEVRNGAHAALFDMVGFSFTPRKDGTSDPIIEQVLKQTFDDLSNWEKNSAKFAAHSKTTAQRAFNLAAFNDPVNSRELITGDQITRITSKDQSLVGIKKAMYWASGQNNDLAEGWEEFATRLIQVRAYGTGETDPTNPVNQEFLAAKKADELINTVSSVYTVVRTSGPEASRKVLDLWPTTLAKEGALSLPRRFGAADAADMSDQVSDVLDYVSLYDPQRDWKRSGLANLTMWAQNTYGRDNPLLAPLYSTGSTQVAQLPAHLSVNWSKVHGILPKNQVLSDGSRFAQDIWNGKDALNDPHTYNSLVFKNDGAWRYNRDTGDIEAFLFPGRAGSAAAPSNSNPGPAQRLYYNTAEPGARPILSPVRIKFDDVLDFSFVYRHSRVGGNPNNPSVEDYTNPQFTFPASY